MLILNLYGPDQCARMQVQYQIEEKKINEIFFSFGSVSIFTYFIGLLLNCSVQTVNAIELTTVYANK